LSSSDREKGKKEETVALFCSLFFGESSASARGDKEEEDDGTKKEQSQLDLRRASRAVEP
jgi:hypothetical protein